MQRFHLLRSLLACIAFGFGEAFAQSTPIPAGSTTSPQPTPSLPSVPTSAVDPEIIVRPEPMPARTVINDSAWNVSTLTPPAASTPSAARLVNLSVRAPLASGDATLIAGAGVSGQGTMPVLARAIGPGLQPFGVAHALSYAPDISIYAGDQLHAETNTIVPGSVAVSSWVGAFPAVANSPGVADGDAALLGNIGPGTLTAHCSSSKPTTLAITNGPIAMLEFYDAGSNGAATAAHFVNFSARTRVGTDDNIVIIGFVVRGTGQITLLLRGVGPTLQQFGVTDILADPEIELYSGNTLIATNDDWQSAAGASISAAADSVGAFQLSSVNDAALLVTLSAGTYTLHVRGAAKTNASSGVALAEIYELPATSPFNAATAVNGVGLNLYRQLAAGSADGNLILSPYSIETAFALAYVGAAGNTRTEMAHVLGFPDDTLSLISGLDELRAGLDAAAANSAAIAETRNAHGGTFESIQWQVANRAFGQTGFPFRASYLTTLADGFDAPLESLDFASQPEPSRITINDWVARTTHDRIRNLIPQGGVTDLTRFVLVNALYLKAQWDSPFEPALTTQQPFHLTNGESPVVPMMRKTDTIGYGTGAGYSVATLPYLGSDLQFVIILPDAGVPVDAIAAQLTTSDILRWSTLTTRTPTNVTLSLPKFTAASPSLSLGDAFIALGMKTAFGIPEGSANFDGIVPRDLKYVQLAHVFHQTFVAVDEHGTEAAAATAIVGNATFVPIPNVTFTVDRPFLFAIQHRPSGALLFFGRVVDPR